MKQRNISLISSQGRSFSVDLAMIKQHLQTHLSPEDPFFRYYVNNEKSKNALANEGFLRAKREFCEEIGDTICVDTSLEPRVKNLAENGKHIMLSVPYGYLFSKMRDVQNGKNHKYKTLKNYTHIITGSPFADEVMQKAYELEGIQIISGVSHPFAWDILQQDRIDEVRSQVEHYFPQAKGKKIVSLLVYGELKKKEKNPFADVDVKRLVDAFDKDYFLITNNQVLEGSAYVLTGEYSDRFGFINRIMPTQDLLYVSEGIITNNSRFAACFAGKHKPVYSVAYTGTVFEKYMRENYPSLHIQDLNKEIERIADMKVTKEHAAFFDNMAYKDPKEPYKAIEDILL